MNRNEIIETLRANETELRVRGVRHAALFGSYARGDAHPGSDIDILIELEDDPKRSFFSHVDIKCFVADLFPGRVDVINRRMLKSGLAAPIERDLLRAF